MGKQRPRGREGPTQGLTVSERAGRGGQVLLVPYYSSHCVGGKLPQDRRDAFLPDWQSQGQQTCRQREREHTGSGLGSDAHADFTRGHSTDGGPEAQAVRDPECWFLTDGSHWDQP